MKTGVQPSCRLYVTRVLAHGGPLTRVIVGAHMWIEPSCVARHPISQVGKASLLDALVFVERCGVQSFWMLKQLAHLSGTTMDEGMEQQAAPPASRRPLVVGDGAADCPMMQRPLRKQLRLSNHALAARARVPDDVRQRLWKYFWCMRQMFHENFVAVLAFDASRVGGKGCFPRILLPAGRIRSMASSAGRLGPGHGPQSRCCGRSWGPLFQPKFGLCSRGVWFFMRLFLGDVSYNGGGGECSRSNTDFVMRLFLGVSRRIWHIKNFHVRPRSRAKTGHAAPVSGDERHGFAGHLGVGRPGEGAGGCNAGRHIAMGEGRLGLVEIAEGRRRAASWGGG